MRAGGRALVWVVSGFLAACSPNTPAPEATSPSAPTAAAPAPSKGAATAPQPPAKAFQVTAAEKAFTDYAAPDDRALAWVGQYYAVTKTKVDYTAVAQRLDATYRQVSNAFAKRDALAAFKTKLDQAIAEASANPYIRLPPFQADLAPYDLDGQRYALAELLAPDSIVDVANGAAQVRFAPAEALASYAPANEAEARTVEHTLSHEAFPRKVEVTVFGKVVDGELVGGRPRLVVLPARVALTTFSLEGPGRPVLTATVP